MKINQLKRSDYLIPKMSKMSKVLLVNIVVTFVFILIFDVTMFVFLPAEWRFRNYRHTLVMGGRGNYPQDYFVSHKIRGFDIGRNKRSSHLVENLTYPIWSNSLGCFDKEHSEYNRYIYFAGDSFTWGYTPFHDKFGTVIESSTDSQVLKCGVTHTGQRHQFEKLTDIVEEIGKPPRAIFVFYYMNDVANDYAHPHTTVVDDWQINSVSLDSNDELVRSSRQELTQRIQKKLQENQRLKNILLHYSLSINIISESKNRFVAKISKLTNTNSKNMSELTSTNLKSFYFLQREDNRMLMDDGYLDNPKTEKNRFALLDFAKFATDRNAEFIVVLIPPIHNFNDTKWFEGIKHFLNSNHIRHLDLTSKFEEKELTSSDLYWLQDEHLNPAGNRIVAEILLEEFGDIFRQD